MSGRGFRLHGGPLASLVGPLLAAIAQARATPPAIRVIPQLMIATGLAAYPFRAIVIHS